MNPTQTSPPPVQPVRRLRDRFWFHLIIVIGLCALMYVLFFASLSWITRHGDDAQVPVLKNKDVRQAMATARDMGFELDIDSAYEPGKKALTVLRQSPDPGESVKKGRTLFITVNKVLPPMTPMPNLLNLSFRSAALIINSNRLVIGDTIYRPDFAKGAVLEQSYHGAIIRPGQMIPQGSRIDLVIGDGLGDTEQNVPDVAGMSFQEAVSTLSSSGLQYVAVFDGAITDTASAIVYIQTPNAINELGVPSRIREGDVIDLRIKQFASADEIDSIKNAGRMQDIPDDGSAEEYMPQAVPRPRPATLPAPAQPARTPYTAPVERQSQTPKGRLPVQH